MKLISRFFIYLFCLTTTFSCTATSNKIDRNSNAKKVITGAEQIGEYLPLIKDKSIAIVANQTSIVGKQHIVDTLLKLKVNIKVVFAPEHGFRGETEAGESVASGKDVITGLPLTSLYGDHKKPLQEDLKDIDIVLFDIQDVGARFYTYISTLQYVMEACAEKGIPVLLLDRPNPNGNFVDGPLLDTAFSSFIGMQQIPVVHGMTIAEYAAMLNGEDWLQNKVKCELISIKMKNWDHGSSYDLPVAPSPNLPNMAAIYLYPSLCFFEGTMVSVGRGTDYPFQVIGYPGMPDASFSFTPRSIKGKAVKPLYEGQKCNGLDLRNFKAEQNNDFKKINLKWLIESYSTAKNKSVFFTDFFDKLAGTDQLRLQIMSGIGEDDIHRSWRTGLDEFKKKRKKYLLYTDFE